MRPAVSAADTALSRGRRQAGTRGRLVSLTTPQQLRRLLVGLLAATLIVSVLGGVLLLERDAVAGAVHETSFPAYRDALAAGAALSDADRAAWQSFRSGAAQLTGPGRVYQDDITTAGQDLEALAALAPAGGAASQELQTASGQLVAYQALVEQADAANRSDIATGTASSHDLGYAYLAYSTSAMRARAGGLLATISELAAANRETLDQKLASPWTDPALIVIFGAADIVLIGGLFGAGRFLLRRFRRVVSVPLVLAMTLAVALLAWLAAVMVPADASLSAARSAALPRLTQTWDRQAGAVTASAKALAANAHASAVGQGGALNVTATDHASAVVAADLSAGQRTGGLPVGLPPLAIAIAVLTFLGIGIRLAEYRG
jgi:hypothetical protein